MSSLQQSPIFTSTKSILSPKLLTYSDTIQPLSLDKLKFQTPVNEQQFSVYRRFPRESLVVARHTINRLRNRAAMLKTSHDEDLKTWKHEVNKIPKQYICDRSEDFRTNLWYKFQHNSKVLPECSTPNEAAISSKQLPTTTESSSQKSVYEYLSPISRYCRSMPMCNYSFNQNNNPNNYKYDSYRKIDGFVDHLTSPKALSFYDYLKKSNDSPSNIFFDNTSYSLEFGNLFSDNLHCRKLFNDKHQCLESYAYELNECFENDINPNDFQNGIEQQEQNLINYSINQELQMQRRTSNDKCKQIDFTTIKYCPQNEFFKTAKILELAANAMAKASNRVTSTMSNNCNEQKKI
ncbi:unnamed protein product [Didymodactylos carnosus]|uniref:Uncharacterized protein n=1 Tax=Didymodactylos carnosus TaxID=1234261 RepID=A0A813Z3M9_9BILA|nr:unnamed protein product [Didymodactylos carnosus]CAF3677815.1 unnamed protein product [Didymodactylos carnosus]